MISVVIPAYNEEKTIEEVVRDCQAYFGSPEIVVVNDCSTDGTTDILNYLKNLIRFKVKHYKNDVNMGHAKSLLKGLSLAGGDHILYMDADNQIRADAMDFDLVSGYRVHRKDRFFRKVVSFILKLTILIRHRYYIRDANCPFKIFKRTSLEKLMEKLPEDCVLPSVCLEILARRCGMKAVQLPVCHFSYKNRTGTLQSINKKSVVMFWKSFWEVIRL